MGISRKVGHNGARRIGKVTWDAKPVESEIMKVKEDWIDYNGHLNMAYYNVLFDTAVDEVFLRLGLGPDYVKTRGASYFTAEVHVCYVRELSAGMPVTVMPREAKSSGLDRSLPGPGKTMCLL